MIIETFKDISSTIDYGIIDNNNGIEKLEKVRDYTLKKNLRKILIYHIIILIKTRVENFFHESNEKLKEDCIELGKLLLHWYDDRKADRSDKNKYVLSIFKLNSSE